MKPYIDMMRLDCGLCIVCDWTPGDRESLLTHANNRNVWRNLGERFPHAYTQSGANEWFSLLANSMDPTHWAMDVGGLAVGGIGIDRGEFEYRKSGRIGYWLGERLKVYYDKAFSKTARSSTESCTRSWPILSVR